MGAIHSVKKRFNEAIEMFNKTIQMSPRESRAYLGMAKIYVQLSDTEAANSYFRKVIELSPNTSIAEFAEQSMARASSVQEFPISQDQRIENLPSVGVELTGKTGNRVDLKLKEKPAPAAPPAPQAKKG